jgi:hypothetical protein
MNPDIERLAREAGMTYRNNMPIEMLQGTPHQIEAFTRAVAAECARVAENGDFHNMTEPKGRKIADAIRAKFGVKP